MIGESIFCEINKPELELTHIHEALPGWKRSILSPAQERNMLGQCLFFLFCFGFFFCLLQKSDMA